MLQTRIDLFVDAKSCQKNYEGCNILIFIEMLGRLSSRVDGFLGIHIIHSFIDYKLRSLEARNMLTIF